MDVALDPGPILGSLVAHAVPGVEAVDASAGTVRRAVRFTTGPAVVDVRLGADRVEVDAAGAPAAEVAALVERWFGLRDDLDAVRAHLGRDARLAPLVAARPHLRVLGHPDGFEAAVQTVLGQQVSLAAARTFTGRFAAAYGEAGPGGLTLFPTPAAVAGRSPDELQAAVRVTHARARTLASLAEACAGGLDLRPGADHSDVRARLLALPGIGPWTVDYLALRVLGDRDAFPSGDLVLRRALGVDHARDVVAAGTAWAPLRAFAAQHLWTSTAYAI
ncbi:DNA-3-methyladenine glycosylase 2 family protein [Cellulomonas sp. JH27-2]|uniref:DNA-3-methyladenine glycosylase family protein n=1 Tax=Cellulomonas sp. JH27-2 TaxID=2774139 RepID=UPI00177B2B70|nr:DNA-3-methyladenine glycosylase 2 family protein [Cellulomonas sp. JH27-2]MBD8060362.1 DNA-3-methyladenine glycosylase 2 family protein [Cellulomonas sp. JH27-2]